MKYTILLLTFMMSLGASEAESELSKSVKPDPGGYLFPQVQKLDDGLYTWPVNGVLHGCMERVTQDNIHLWKHFGETEKKASSYPTPFRTQRESLWAQLTIAKENGQDSRSYRCYLSEGL